MASAMTIFVLEGPDFAGKTTLAHRLHSALVRDGSTATIQHAGQPDPNNSTPLAQVYANAVAEQYGVDHVIHDRLHVGELVYGPLFRGKAAITRMQMDAIDAALLARGARLLYIRPSDTTLLRRFRGDRGDDLVTQEGQLTAAIVAYDSLIGPNLTSPWQHVGADALTDAEIASLISGAAQ